MSTDRSLSVDALRGLAALSVVLCHAHAVEGMGVGWYDAFLSFFERAGGHGVDLFFVLSGFCIHWGYSASKDAFDTEKYLKRRWLRIYPPYFFALFFSLSLAMAGAYLKWRSALPVSLDNFGLLQVMSHLFLVHNFFEKTMYAINGPLWTIALEAQFYLLYLLVRRSMFGKKGWMSLFVIAGLLYLFSWQMTAREGFQPFTMFRFWPQWLLGAWAAYLYRTNRKRLESFGMGLWILFPILFFTGERLSHRPGAEPESILVLGAAFFCLLLAALGIPQKRWEAPATRWLPFAGVFSYSIYLVHYPMLDRWRQNVVLEMPRGILRMLFSILGIVAILVFAYLFFLLFEKPYLRKKEPALNEFP